MTNKVHGHEVMQMMLESDTAYTRKTLQEAMLKRFGEDARFHTCSAEGMTADELIIFLEQRGKFVDSGEGFTTDPDRICNH